MFLSVLQVHPNDFGVLSFEKIWSQLSCIINFGIIML